MTYSRQHTLINVKRITLLLIACSVWLSIILSILAQPVLAQAQKFTEQRVEIVATDNFKLSAQFFPGLTTAAGVLFLHDCQHSVIDFQPLYSALIQRGLFVLALDLRGYGNSQSTLYSAQKIRLQTSDIVSYQGQLAALMINWQKDVFQAYQYLQRAMKNNQAISIVTSGCSSNQAIYLAEKAALKSLVMLDPELSYGDKEQFKRLTDMPIYLISTKHQTGAMLNAQELFEWSGDKHSVLQTFKGNGSGYDLLKHQAYLNEHIATWLQSSLEKQ